MNNIRVAAVVMQSIVGKIKTNISQIYYWVKEASKLNIDIVCFPELCLTGYSNHPDMASIAILRSDREIENLKSLSADTNIIIMPGIAEKDVSGKIYITHLIITPSGKVNSYRKIHLAPMEKKIFDKGETVSLFQMKEITFGIQLCYDAHFPELTTCMSQGGADIVLIPHASPRGTAKDKHHSWMRHLPARAFDNGIYIVACNQTGNNGRKLNFPGNAVAFSPSGKIMKKKLSKGEGMIVINLKKEHLEYVRQHKMRYFLPNRRPELYTNTPTTIILDNS